ncbi:MAG TPA: hypothetical protein VHF22_02470, partial [Planctomycetota bacterium]|nr:hypothetical protein [Planctomycetota bacterium]
DLVSKACGEAAHRALRTRREADEADHAVFYAARAEAIRDEARALLAEAHIVLERTIGDLEPPPRAASRADDDEP